MTSLYVVMMTEDKHFEKMLFLWKNFNLDIFDNFCLGKTFKHSMHLINMLAHKYQLSIIIWQCLNPYLSKWLIFLKLKLKFKLNLIYWNKVIDIRVGILGEMETSRNEFICHLQKSLIIF